MDRHETHSELVRLMVRCQADTHRILGPGAAARLAYWQRHEDDLATLVRFIANRLQNTGTNGYKLRLSKGLSLEEVVAERLPELFSEEDRGKARATLGLKV